MGHVTAHSGDSPLILHSDRLVFSVPKSHPQMTSPGGTPSQLLAPHTTGQIAPGRRNQPRDGLAAGNCGASAATPKKGSGVGQ